MGSIIKDKATGLLKPATTAIGDRIDVAIIMNNG